MMRLQAIKSGMRRSFRGIALGWEFAYLKCMGRPKICPECGSHQIKTLVPMTGTQEAYLCENGHFFIESIPSQGVAAIAP